MQSRIRSFTLVALVLLLCLTLFGYWWPDRSGSGGLADSALQVLSQPSLRKPHSFTYSHNRLLVIVIAGLEDKKARNEFYSTAKRVWLDLAERVAPVGVDIYLTSFSDDVSPSPFRLSSTGHELMFQGVNSVIPGAWRATILALECIFENKLPGWNATHVLRTNLSSLWNFALLIAIVKGAALKQFYAGVIGTETNEQFVSGAGALMSVDLAHVLARHKLEFWNVSDVYDDVAMMRVIKRDVPHVKLTPLLRNNDFDRWDSQSAPESFRYDNASYHFRVKSIDSAVDAVVFRALYYMVYGNAIDSPAAHEASTDALLAEAPVHVPLICFRRAHQVNVWPVQFGVGRQELPVPLATDARTFGFTSAVATDGSGSADDALTAYRNAFYVVAMRGGGWDSVRHYEILAAGAVPYLLDLSVLPKSTMRFFPRRLIAELMTLPGVDVSYTPVLDGHFCCNTVHATNVNMTLFPKQRFATLSALLREYTQRHLTTKAIARYMLDVTANAHAKTVLFVADAPSTSLHADANHLDASVMQGFKLLLPAGQFCVYPSDPAWLFDDWSGNASSAYSGRLSRSLRCESAWSTADVAARIARRAFDVIIYGQGTGDVTTKPFWKDVLHDYRMSPHRVIHVHGEDVRSDIVPATDACDNIFSQRAILDEASNLHMIFKREI